MIDHIEKAHFISIENKWAYIDTKIPPVEELTRNIPSVKEGTIMKKRLAKGKDNDKGRIFGRSKVRLELICDGCNNH